MVMDLFMIKEVICYRKPVEIISIIHNDSTATCAGQRVRLPEPIARIFALNVEEKGRYA